jgi:hypothetical protein
LSAQRRAPYQLRMARHRRAPEHPSAGERKLAEALGRMSFSSGLAAASVLVMIGLAVSVFPAGAGWLGLVPDTKNHFYAMAFFVFVAGSVFALRRWSDRRLLHSDVRIEQLSWEQFEGYLAAYYRSRGVKVTYRGGGTADGGVDLILEDATGRRILQAKHWKERSVGVVPLRALWGVREDERAHGAVFVTSGYFTRDAREFARGKQLELIDGAELRRVVREAKRVVADAPQVQPVSAGPERCPGCGEGSLVERVARRGQNAGSTFLGCTRYPRCTFTRRSAAVPQLAR